MKRGQRHTGNASSQPNAGLAPCESFTYKVPEFKSYQFQTVLNHFFGTTFFTYFTPPYRAHLEDQER